jgi:hypothetical protein
MPWQVRPATEHVRFAQQTCPAPPQVLHVPTPPPVQTVVADVHVRFMQQG